MDESSDIEVRTELRDDATILHPIGDIDLSRATSLRNHLKTALSSNPVRLILDLAEVTYMDSSGVATLIEAVGLARETGSALVLCNLQRRVRSIFEIARLEMVFTIADDMDGALAN